MNKDLIITSIGSYKKRLEGRKEDAIAAIRDGAMWSAQIALGECIGFEAAIAELEFQLEAMEVTGDD
jgi:hypothetical protein